MKSIGQSEAAPVASVRSNENFARRTGQVVVFLAILIPVIFGILGLVVDTGLLMSQRRNLQHSADAAATAGARALALGESQASAIEIARQYVNDYNGFPTADVEVNIPPTSGNHIGASGFVEVIATQQSETYFMQVLGSEPLQTVRSRSVAGRESATSGAAVVVLDEDPTPVSIPPLPTLPLLTLPPVLGGMEVLGLGTLRVDGSVLVNTKWGGVDQDGNPAGESAGPPYGISCTPLISLTKLRARDIRVAGGVDNQNNYGNFVTSESSPLEANRLPVPDPYTNLPVPTVTSDSANVSNVSRGHVSVTGLPLIGPPVTLNPGVYDSIQVVSGIAVFNPGVYIIRGVNPITQISLSIVAGQVTADGVMFYITNSTSYSAGSGTPDSNDNETQPVAPGVTTIMPSAVINAGLLGSHFSPLDDPGSPFNGLLIYQRRADRRPIVIASDGLLSSDTLAGTIYSKWGHIIFAASGTFDLRLVAGTMRFANVLNVTLAPSQLLPPAQDVYLVE